MFLLNLISCSEESLNKYYHHPQSYIYIYIFTPLTLHPNSESPSPFPNFEFPIVSPSAFTELERRAPDETLTRGSPSSSVNTDRDTVGERGYPFQFREHGP